eukprot:m.39610 g.39610  ORF g.39610 m.39610 type:complete len:671 (-) comp18249_c0_seq1:177-2189(-)
MIVVLLTSMLVLGGATMASTQNLYPLPAHVTKTPLGGGGAISIDASLAVTSARPLTAPFAAAILTRYQLLLRNKASAHIAQKTGMRLTSVVVDVASGSDDTLGPSTNESYALSFALVHGAVSRATVAPSYWWRFPGSDCCSSGCDLPTPASVPSDTECPKAVFLKNGSAWGTWCVARFKAACTNLTGCGGFNTDRIFKDTSCNNEVGPLKPSDSNVDLYTLGTTPVPPPLPTVTATVTAATIYGARHGLETLAQLVKAPAGVIEETVAIVDGPVYPYRGLMIDTGRHFLSLSLIRHAIDGLAALKMNVLHWHLLDSQSFPVASQAYPQLSAAGAFAAAATYTLDDLRSIVAYAKQRGVRVVPEIEMPGHGSFSAGMPELSLSSCADVLDPTRNSTYVFLAAFLAEMVSVFEDELIYLGGDEVGVGEGCEFNGTHFQYCGFHCFDTDPKVSAWMAAQTPPLNSTELVQYFWTQLSKRVLPALNRTPGVWMSDTPNHIPVFLRPDMTKLPAGAVANVYQDWQAAGPLLDTGTPVVLSVAYDGWYLDGHPDFATVYNLHPCDTAWLACDAHPKRRALLRGGSASMWGERVDATNFDVEVWPGTTALAERLWSDPPSTNITAAAAAEARHAALACHWKMWGVPTITREKAGSEFVSVLDAALPPCPADWCAVPP